MIVTLGADSHVRPVLTRGEAVKRSIVTVLVAIASFAIPASASAHVVTKAEVTCTGITVSWTNFPGGPFDMNIPFQDQANGKDVPSPYVVAHLSGSSGTKFIAAPAAAGVTFRKALATWTVDGGGSASASAVVSCGETPKPPPPPTGTTVTVTVPVQTVTVTKTVTTPGATTPGVTTPGATTPGQTVTVTKTVALPAPPAQTVTVAGPAVPGPTVTVTTPGATRTIIKHKTRTVIRYRNRRVIVNCGLRGWNGSYSMPPGGKPGPIVATCAQGKQGTLGAGVTG